jgi:hypothetical protein
LKEIRKATEATFFDLILPFFFIPSKKRVIKTRITEVKTPFYRVNREA